MPNTQLAKMKLPPKKGKSVLPTGGKDRFDGAKFIKPPAKVIPNKSKPLRTRYV